MKIAVVGAGAMGCRIGSMLYEAGHDVALVDEWREHVNAIQSKGLEIVKENGSHLLRIPVFLPCEIKGPVELIIVFCKATQTKSMIQSCRHVINDTTLVLTLQNGLGNIDVIEQYVAKQFILAGVTTFAAELLGPGKILALGSGETEIMQVEGHRTKKVEVLAQSMNDAGINITISSNVLTTIWSKVAFNSVLNPLCTLLDCNVATIGSCSDTEEVMNNIIDEIILVALAEGVELQREPIQQMIKKVFDPAMSGHHLGSMHKDMSSGRPTEIEYLNGAIVSKGKVHDIAVPTNMLIYHLIRMKEETRKLSVE